MKTTKFLILSLAILFTFSLQAQDKSPANSTAPASMEKAATPRPESPSKEQRAAKMQERQAAITEKLGLTPEQETQFMAINKKYRDQVQEARANGGEDRKAMRQEMKAINDARKAELATVLTPEQMELLKSENQAARSKQRQRPAHKQDGGK